MNTRSIALTTLAAALLSVAAPYARAQNLLTNGSFETGDLTGWTLTGNTGPAYVANSFDGYGPEDGNYAYYFGQVDSDGILSQTFSDTAGDQLNISFWLAGNGTTTSHFGAEFDGTSLVDYFPTVPNQPYTEYNFTVTATGSDTLTFLLRNDPSYGALDNASVTDAGPGGFTSAPEPATYGWFGVAALMAVVAWRRFGGASRLALASRVG